MEERASIESQICEPVGIASFLLLCVTCVCNSAVQRWKIYLRARRVFSGQKSLHTHMQSSFVLE